MVGYQWTETLVLSLIFFTLACCWETTETEGNLDEVGEEVLHALLHVLSLESVLCKLGSIHQPVVTHLHVNKLHKELKLCFGFVASYTCPLSYQGYHSETGCNLRALMEYRVPVTGTTESVSPLHLRVTQQDIIIIVPNLDGYKRQLIEKRLRYIPENPYPEACTDELLVDWKHRERRIRPFFSNNVTKTHHKLCHSENKRKFNCKIW